MPAVLARRQELPVLKILTRTRIPIPLGKEFVFKGGTNQVRLGC